MLQDGDWSIPGQEKVFWVPGDQSEIDVVRFIFRERSRSTGIAMIARILNERSISCPKRGRWRNKDQKWSSITIKSIIENPAYYGARAYNKNSMSKIRADNEGWSKRSGIQYPHWRQAESEWVIVENAHEPLVEKELWLQASSFRNSKRPPQIKQAAPYLLSGLIVCLKCGFHFQGQTVGSKGKRYHQYICGGYNAKRVCEYVRLKRDPLEKYVLGCIHEMLSNNILIEKVRDTLKKILKVSLKRHHSLDENIEPLIKQNEEKQNRIIKAIEEGAPTNTFNNRLTILEKERKKLLQAREEMEKKKEVVLEVEDTARVVNEFCLHFDEHFEAATLAQKKELVRRCLKGIEVDHNTRSVKCFVWKLPLIGPILEQQLSVQVEKQTATSEKKSPFINAPVAGARDAHHCKIDPLLEELSYVSVLENLKI